MNNAKLYTEEKWNILTSFSKKNDLKAGLWNEILERHSEPYRFYHTIGHVAAMFNLCDQYLSEVENPLAVGFAILYRNIVCDTFKNDNAEESAAIAKRHLMLLLVKPAIIKEVEQLILTAGQHVLPEEEAYSTDLPLFLDFDLAIMGEEWPKYELYMQQIRKEFRQYPDDTYNPGRKNALENLLKKETLFFTPLLREVFEPTARKNIFREIQLLS